MRLRKLKTQSGKEVLIKDSVGFELHVIDVDDPVISDEAQEGMTIDELERIAKKLKKGNSPKGDTMNTMHRQETPAPQTDNGASEQ